MNNISNSQRAEVLTQALPYIRSYRNKIIVVKYGGNAMINEELQSAVIGDLVLLSLIGIKVVLVHGGGPEINETLNKMNMRSEFIDGLRVTDKDTAEVVQMVLAGKINKNLVNMILNKGGKAVGLCGVDDHMIMAQKLDDVHGFVGKITSVNTELVVDLIEKDYIPVISTIGCDDDNNTYNINADTVAAYLAGALEAECLINMSDIPGLLMDKDDPSTLIRRVFVSDAPDLIHRGIISGGMIPKIKCCIEAIRRGVKKVFIIDGRVPHSILIEIFTNDGLGTMFLE